ncbi:methyltransferase [Saccharothrix xinjiangensis]|uniref:Methyltransferase n=1 Tax=Saccharothrix xinjiangensis TaxID=204798 RepID=A0ABV9YDA4_9PSEU
MAASPDTPAATRHALVNMIFGSMAAQVVAACVRLGVPDVLGDGERSADEVAAACGASPRTTLRLLRAATALKLLEERGDRFAATGLGALLRSDAPGSMHAFARVFTDPVLLRAWHRLDDGVRTGATTFDEEFGTSFFDHLGSRPELATAFNAAMSQGTHVVAGVLPDAHDFGRYDVVMDVGGGDGTLLAAVLSRHTGPRGVLFDTATGSSEAEGVLAAAGVASRCEVVTGDFFASVPDGSDAVLLKSVLHDWDDDRAGKVLRHCRAALPEHGRLLVVEPVLPDSVPDDVSPVIYLSDLNMLVNLGGQERTRAEYADLLAGNGFTVTDVTPLPPSGFCLVEAEAG